MTETKELTVESKMAEPVTATSRAGKYLTFRLDKEEYGLKILTVREIIGLMDITPIPKTPEYFCGIVNLRDSIIPVLDLKHKFNMGVTENTEETCIIVVEVDLNDRKIMMGALVDAVSEVLDIKDEEIEDAPSFGTNVNSNFILGIGKVKDEVKLLLDIDKVLINSEDIAILEDLGKNN